MPATVDRYHTNPQDHGLELALDNTTLLRLCRPALEEREPVSATLVANSEMSACLRSAVIDIGRASYQLMIRTGRKLPASTFANATRA